MKLWKHFLLIAWILLNSTTSLYSSLSQKKMDYYWKWNSIKTKTDYNPRAHRRNERIKPSDMYDIKWKLQYLLWDSPTVTYMKLNKDHQELIQKISQIILTDEYAQDIEDKRDWTDKKLEKIEWTKLNTTVLTLIVKKVIDLSSSIENVNSWSGKWYKGVLKSIKRFEKKWYITDSKILILIDTLKPEIEAVMELHRLLNEKAGKDSMDYNKKYDILIKEIAETKNRIEKTKNRIEKTKKDIIKLKEKNAKLEAFIKVANRFLDINKHKLNSSY